MLVLLVLSISLSVSDATINELVSASEQQPLESHTFAPPFPNDGIESDMVFGTPNNLTPIQSQVPSGTQNGVNCPNKTILLNLVNMLINSLHQEDKTILDPEKFKYLLTVVKNFLETTPSNPENLEVHDKFQNIEANPIRVQDANPTPKISLQFDLLNTQHNHCKDIFNNLMNFINTAYAQVLTHCLTTETCNIKNLNDIRSGYNGINPFYPFAPIQKNSTNNIWSFHENLPKESVTAGADQRDQGARDIMSMLENYKPSGAYPPIQESKNPNGFQNPPNGAPGNNQAASLYPPINEMIGKNPNLQPSNTYVPTNMNMVQWQTTFPGLEGLTGKNQQLEQLFKKFYNENNVGVTSSSHPRVETLLQPINGQIAPVNTGIKSVDQRVFTATNPRINMNPNQVIDILKQVVVPKQNSPQVENKNPNLANMHQYLQRLLNLKIQSSVPPSILSHKPQQSMSSYVVYNQNQILNPANQPLLGVIKQFHQNKLHLNQIPPYLEENSKYNNGQNLFPDNTKQGNNGGALVFDLNHLLGVTNLGKLNAIPNKNGIVELTYMLKRPKPVEESQYYVKYRMPYQTFIYNLQNVLTKKPNLRNEPNNLYQYLLAGSNVTNTPNDLKGLKFEDILKLTFANGTLVTAKILDDNDTAVHQTLRFVQKLNSQLPVESIINFNKNATKNIRMETQKIGVNGTSNNYSANDLLKNVSPGFVDARRGFVYPYLNYPFSTIGQNPPRLQYNPYSLYQTKSTLGNVVMPYLNNAMPGLPNINILKNPALYSSYLVRNPQLGR